MKNKIMLFIAATMLAMNTANAQSLKCQGDFSGSGSVNQTYSASTVYVVYVDSNDCWVILDEDKNWYYPNSTLSGFAQIGHKTLLTSYWAGMKTKHLPVFSGRCL